MPWSRGAKTLTHDTRHAHQGGLDLGQNAMVGKEEPIDEGFVNVIDQGGIESEAWDDGIKILSVDSLHKGRPSSGRFGCELRWLPAGGWFGYSDSM